ncbi:reverse transcriptase [Entamoeba histolytica HM-3:IMSS]|uniref:Reverse transcriptase n=1 Tax=Entamoeba histolytica HM-3:IMSS TaxID=885315 RepID=M7WUU2_ENTHI|nr:reverse transcriptase [Entamoeba histolytica HM-3:IMSS]
MELQLMGNEKKYQVNPCQYVTKRGSIAAKEGSILSLIERNEREANRTRYLESFYDIRKAYDTVNHNWLEIILRYFKVHLESQNY